LCQKDNTFEGLEPTQSKFINHQSSLKLVTIYKRQEIKKYELKNKLEIRKYLFRFPADEKLKNINQ
jgi:hypothetical protein